MIVRNRVLRWISLAAAGVALFVVFLYLLFPAARINQVIGALLSGQGLSLTPACRKTILPGLAWDSPLLSSDKGPLIKGESLRITLRMLPLLTARPVVAASAVIGRGRLELEYALRGEQALSLASSGIVLSDIPFFSSVLGARAGGELWSEGGLVRSKTGISGEVKLEIRQLSLSGVRLGSFPLPDVANLRTQGMIKVTNGSPRLESFTLEGDGVYMRLSGNLPTGANAATQPLALTLEIMPRAEFMEKQKLVFMLLAKFMTSPGVYRVPIKGTLLKPEII